MKKLAYGIVIGAVVLGVGGYLGINSFAQSDRAQDAQAVADTTPVIIESEKIIVDAVVVPVREADLSVATNGIVKAIMVEEGDYVEAGQPLLQLNDERLQAALAQSEANLANAEANLAELLAPPKAEEIAKYQASITSAQASLQTVLDGASNAEIAAKEASLANAAAEMRIAQSDYDEEKWRTDIAMRSEALELEKATNNYNAAKADLDDLLTEADRSDVASANANIVSAQSDLELLLIGAGNEAIQAAKATVSANQASVRDAQSALNEATLVAPFSGIVAAVNSEIGEQISSGAAAIQLADITEWRIETEDLTELDVVNVVHGDSVEVSFDALDKVILNGTVKNIKPLGENNQGDITYTVLVELEEQDERLRWNMSAEANIRANEDGRVAAGQAATASQLLLSENAAQNQTSSSSLTVADVLAMNNGTDMESGFGRIEHESSIISGAGSAAGIGTAPVDVNGSALNVRLGPDTSFAVIDSLPDTSSVSILSTNDDATWIEVALETGETGWASADYLSLELSSENLVVSGEQNGL